MVRRVRTPESEKRSTDIPRTDRHGSRAGTLPPEPPSEPAYARIPSFFGLERFDSSAPVPQLDVLLSGVPHDRGSIERAGARLGPRAVRDASLTMGGYSDALGIDVWQEIRAADGGDLKVGTSPTEEALEIVSRRAEAIARSGVVGGYIGGDQTVTLGVLRGIQRAKLKSVSMVHIDASTDTLGSLGSRKVHHHNVLRLAVEEGLIRPDGVVQVGVRGPHVSEKELSLAVNQGFEIIKVDEVKWDVHAAVSQIRKVVRRGALYVSVDVCALDPAIAPGAGSLRAGGMNTWELQQILRALVGAQIVGFDVVEVTPPFDPSGVTALAAATVLHEILAVLADTHRSARPASSSKGRKRGRRLSP